MVFECATFVCKPTFRQFGCVLCRKLSVCWISVERFQTKQPTLRLPYACLEVWRSLLVDYVQGCVKFQASNIVYNESELTTAVPSR